MAAEVADRRDPPTPWKTRLATRWAPEVERAAARDPTVKMTMPAR